jgi:branched-chain amino acid transport system permease protein
MTDVIQHVIDAISLGSLYALLALGIALIFGIMRLLNFAHGMLIVIGAYALSIFDGIPAAPQILLALLAAMVAAIALELVAFRPLRRADPAVLLVSSFAVALFLQNLAIVIFGGQAKGVPLPDLFTENLSIAGLRIPVLSIITIIVAAVTLGALALFLNRTPIGIQMRAAAESFSTARLLGVKANSVIQVAFAISGLLAGLAAVLIVARGGTVTPEMGTAPVLIGFVAVIIGGLGSLKGAVYGGFLLGALTVVLQVVLPVSLEPFRDAFVFGVVLLVLTIRPQGLVVLKSTLQRA